MTKQQQHILFALGLGLFMLTSSNGNAQKTYPVLVCYLGGPIPIAQAEKSMTAMMQNVERLGNLPSNIFTVSFVNDLEQCQKQIKQNPPAILFPSLGLYLRYAKKLALVPMVKPVLQGPKQERYYVIVQPGTADDMKSLRGKTIGGSLLEDLDFLNTIVFQDELNLKQDYILKPSKRSLRAIRKLTKGQLDAVLLNSQQYHALKALPFFSKLKPIFISKPLPTVGLVANANKTNESLRKGISKALVALCHDDSSKNLCKLFGIQSFQAVDNTVYASLRKRWER